PRRLRSLRPSGRDGGLASGVRSGGYLGRRRPPANGDTATHERPFVIATSGGGVDGPALLQTFVHAAARLQPQTGGTWLAVTGPLMSDADHAQVVSLADADGI